MINIAAENAVDVARARFSAKFAYSFASHETLRKSFGDEWSKGSGGPLNHRPALTYALVERRALR